MITYLLVSIASGILLAILDVAINANPLARRLFEVYQPIARTSFNPIVGVLIDLMYGFFLTMLFLLLYISLPGTTGIFKGIIFAIVVWFLRVFMSAASQWVMFNIPIKTLLYSLLAGLGQMLALGILYGLVFTGEV